jgi:hypothetical protein
MLYDYITLQNDAESKLPRKDQYSLRSLSSDEICHVLEATGSQLERYLTTLHK